MPTHLRDITPGVIVIVRTPMRTADGERDEFREIVYRREPGEARPDGTVPITRLRCMQGCSPALVPRYDSGPVACRDPGYAHGLTLVEPGQDSAWYPRVLEAVIQSQGKLQP